ncbi:hypothetical protein QYF61_026557 [Mycteria americana]|uniref:Uncharacterized protein n=1 Tax=Mycteria americana TaxID=33587 RepID=A0AAN7NZY5_MYCAM|nr:hypothetical protein QYF61_026557 [Mycteria americana]
MQCLGIYHVPSHCLGLKYNGAILYPLEHRAWAQRNGNKWQTVDVNVCVVWEQRGFISENICLDTEQNICNFEIHPDEAPETVLVYIGKGCVCMRTLCDFIFVDNVTVSTSNCSNICVCNFTKVMGCDFNYSAPVTSYQLLQSNYTLSRDLLPTPIGMNLTLNASEKNGYKTLITVHHDSEEIHHVLERVKEDGEHHWWETLLGWSPTAMGVFNLKLHPVVILLTLTLICLLLIIILFMKLKIIVCRRLLPKNLTSVLHQKAQSALRDNLGGLKSECLGFSIKGCMIGLGISWMTLVFSWRGLEGFWSTSEGEVLIVDADQGPCSDTVLQPDSTNCDVLLPEKGCSAELNSSVPITLKGFPIKAKAGC